MNHAVGRERDFRPVACVGVGRRRKRAAAAASGTGPAAPRPGWVRVERGAKGLEGRCVAGRCYVMPRDSFLICCRVLCRGRFVVLSLILPVSSLLSLISPFIPHVPLCLPSASHSWLLVYFPLQLVLVFWKPEIPYFTFALNRVGGRGAGQRSTVMRPVLDAYSVFTVNVRRCHAT